MDYPVGLYNLRSLSSCSYVRLVHVCAGRKDSFLAICQVIGEVKCKANGSGKLSGWAIHTGGSGLRRVWDGILIGPSRAIVTMKVRFTVDCHIESANVAPFTLQSSK